MCLGTYDTLQEAELVRLLNERYYYKDMMETSRQNRLKKLLDDPELTNKLQAEILTHHMKKMLSISK